MIIDKLIKYSNDKFLSFEQEPRTSSYVTNASCFVQFENGLKKTLGSCTRASYYSAIGFKDADVESNRMFSRKLGDYTEYMLLSMMDKSGILIDKGVKFTIEETSTNGKLDAIVEIDGEKRGVEIKSLSSSKYTISKIFGSQWNSPYPKIDHLLQCTVYMFAYINELKKFNLIYIRRDNGDTKEFELELAAINGDLYPVVDGQIDYNISCNSIIDKFLYLKKCLENNIVPDRDYYFVYTDEYAETLYKNKFLSKTMYNKFLDNKFGDFECTTCSFRDMCIKEK